MSSSEGSSEYFFSVVIATYNAAATVERCLRSVLNQSRPVQVLVMDGGSQDITALLVEKWMSEHVHFYSEKDQGVYDAWNKALPYVKGGWVIFLGADDYFSDSTSLEKLQGKLENASIEIDVAYGSVVVVDDSGCVTHSENGPWFPDDLPVGMPYTHVGSAHRVSLFQDRKFDAGYRIAGDYHFLYPLLIERAPLFVPEYQTHMSNGGLSTNRRSRLRLLREMKRIRREHKIRVPLRTRVWTELKFWYYSLRAFGE